MKAQSPLQQEYFVSQRFVQVVRPWGKRPGTLSTSWFLHTMTGGFERGGGLPNGALVSFDCKVHKAVELLCQQVASKHVLPSSLRRRSGGTLGHHPQWFYMPCAVERGHVNGFLVYCRQWTRALEIHCLHFPRRPCCWGDWHRKKEYARKKKKKLG